MLLEARGFQYKLPHRAGTVGPLDLGIEGGITALVGRMGSPATPLLQAWAGRLPLGAAASGHLRTGPLDALRATPSELARHIRLVSRDRFAVGTTAEHLGRWLRGAELRREAAELELTSWLSRPVSALPPDVHVRLCVAELRHAPAADAWALHQLLTPADRPTQALLVAAAKDRAASGATVVWVDHALDPLWPAADRVIEFAAGRIVADDPASEWQPRTLPEPVLMAAARLAGLPPDNRRDAAAISQELSTLGLRRQPPARPASQIGERLPLRIAAADLGLAGDTLEFLAGETISVIALDARPEPMATKLVQTLRAASHLPSALPTALTISQLTSVWERRRGVARGKLRLRQDTAGLPRDTQVENLAADEHAALRLILSEAGADPLWFPHPQLDLDPALRKSLTSQPTTAPPGLRILTSRDVDLLVAASHRILVIDDGAVVALRPPQAVLDLLPQLPLAAAATGLGVTSLAELDPQSVLEVVR